jgi:hypothetical protein
MICVPSRRFARMCISIAAGHLMKESFRFFASSDQIGWTSLSLFYDRAGIIKEAEAVPTKANILSWGGKVAQE